MSELDMFAALSITIELRKLTSGSVGLVWFLMCFGYIAPLGGHQSDVILVAKASVSDGCVYVHKSALVCTSFKLR